MLREIYFHTVCRIYRRRQGVLSKARAKFYQNILGRGVKCDNLRRSNFNSPEDACGRRMDWAESHGGSHVNSYQAVEKTFRMLREPQHERKIVLISKLPRSSWACEGIPKSFSTACYGLMISEDRSSSTCAFSCDMKKAKLFCISPVRNDTSNGPGSPSPTCRATARESLARSMRFVSEK